MEKFKKIALGFFGTVLCGQMAQAEVQCFHSDPILGMKLFIKFDERR
jgi:hypothetical protein